MVTTPRGLSRLGLCNNDAPNTKLGSRMKAQNTKRNGEEMEEMRQTGEKGKGCYNLVTSVRQMLPKKTSKEKVNKINLA